MALLKLQHTDGVRAQDQPPYGACAPNALQRGLIALARATPLSRGFFRRGVTRLIFALGFGRPLDVAFRGCAYRLHGGRNLIENGLLLTPDYNAADIDFLLRGAVAGDVFVDIGSHIGLYALPLAQAAGPRGMVLAVDANPLMAERLAFNAAASGLGNVRIFACGLGDRDGRAALHIRKDDLAIVSIEEDPAGSIPVRTLASVVAESGATRIAGLKIDVEGYEDKVLVPFLTAAPDGLLPRRIVIETSADGTDYPGCAAAFAARGYALVRRTRNNSLYERGG